MKTDVAGFFPDIHHEEQPSVFVFARSADRFAEFDYGTRISNWEDFNDADRRFPLRVNTLKRVNPNTGTVPLFRSRRDVKLTTAIYSHMPVLAEHSSEEEIEAWSVKYVRMFDMTNDSHLFRTKDELEEQEGAWPIGGNRFNRPNGQWVPLYEGKMIQIYNHRYANVRVNPQNISAQGVSERLGSAVLRDPSVGPEPRFWVDAAQLPSTWRIGMNDICNTNNARTFIACAVPPAGFANTLPTFHEEKGVERSDLVLLLANFCSLICDYVARQKIQSRHLNKYIVEQLPVVPLAPLRIHPLRPQNRRSNHPRSRLRTHVHRP